MIQKSSRTGRPRAFEPEVALDSAMRRFWSQGFEATSLDDLEAATGLSRSSLYNTFGTKRELFEHALRRYLDTLEANLLDPLENGTEGLVDIELFIDRLGSQLDDPRFVAGCLLTNSLAEFGGRDASVVRHGNAYLERAGQAIHSALTRAAARGEIEAADVGSRSEVLVGLVLGINLIARSGLGKARLSALVTAVHAELDGWRAAGARPDNP
jgi:TetR/AcrR family transcriptional repressor of nem operon